jgi:hypothetical protein
MIVTLTDRWIGHNVELTERAFEDDEGTRVG